MIHKIKRVSAYYKLLLIAVLYFLLCHSYAQNTGNSIQIYYTSNYIFRDEMANYQAIQPTANYSFKNSGWSFQLASSMELTWQTKKIEITPAVLYQHSFKSNITLSAGAFYYIVSTPVENTLECYMALSSLSLPLSPKLSLYYNTSGYGYATLYMSQPLDKKKPKGSYFYAVLGYKRSRHKMQNGIRELVMGVGVPICVKNHLVWINGILTYLPHAAGKNTCISTGITINLN